MIRKLDENYSDIQFNNVWRAYFIALERLGAEELCEALARAIDPDVLVDDLRYIFKVYNIPFEVEEEDFEESCGRKSKKRKGTKSMKESFENTLYCVVGFDDNTMQSTHFGNATLVAFDNLTNAEDFESLIYDYMKNAEWDDELDSEYFDVTGGYVDDGDDYLSEYSCVGCYTVPVRDILNAQNYDPNIIPGKEVVILNQKDLYDQSTMILCNIPDRFYR